MFVFDTIENKYVPVFGMLGGTKEEPLEIEGNVKRFSIQEDNVMAEYNIPPCNSRKDFINNNLFMIETLKTILPDNKTVLAESFAKFEEEDLIHEQAEYFGCAPSIDVYTLSDFIPVFNVASSPFRACGGHIHIGFEGNDDQNNIIKLVKALDYTLGLRSFFEEKNEDGYLNRNLSYGRFGNFRETSFGIEYRTTSNWWLKNEETIGEAYDLVQEAFILANQEDFDFDPLNLSFQELKSIYLEKNKKLIKK